MALLALCPGVLLAGLLLARKPIAEWAVAGYLASRGVAPVSFSISELGLNGAQVDALLIGDADQPHVSARRITVVLDGMAVTEVLVSGVEVTGILRDGRPDIGPVMVLAGEAEVSGASDAAAPPALPETLPDLTVSGVRVALAGPQGLLAVQLDGAITLVRGTLTGGGPLRIAGPGGMGQGDLNLNLAPDLTGHGTLAARDVTVGPPWLVQPLQVPSLNLALHRSSNHASADLDAELADGSIAASFLGVGPFGRPTMDIGIQVDLPSLAPLLPLLRPFAGDLPLTDGSVDLSLALTATAGDGPDLAAQLRTATGEATLAGKVMLVPSEQATGGQIGDVALTVDMGAAFDDEAVAMNVNRFVGRVGGLRVADLPEQYRRQIGGEAALALESGLMATVSRADLGQVALTGGGSIRTGNLLLRARSNVLNLSAEGASATAATIEVHGLSVEGLLLETLRFEGDVAAAEALAVKGHLSGAGAEWEQGDHAVNRPEFALDIDLRGSGVDDARVSATGSVRAESVVLDGDAVEVKQPEIHLEKLVLAATASEGVSLTAVAQASQAGITFAPLKADGTIGLQPQRIDLDWQGKDLARMTGTFRISSAGAIVPAHLATGSLVLEGRFDLAAEAVEMSARIADVAIDQAIMANVPAMHIDATVNANSAGAKVSGTVGSGPVAIAMNGAMNMRTGAGDATVELPPTLLTHLSDHLHGTVLPDAVTMPDGTLSVRMKLNYDKVLSGNLNVLIEDGTVATADATVSGINAAIELTNLLPPRTGKLQEVRIARLAGPADMTDMLLRFALMQDGDETIARIDHLAGRVFGGELALQPFILRPDEERRAVDVTLRRIDMTQIVELTGLTGFELTGNLSGTLPVVIVGESQVAVNGGLLKADGPGVLRLDGATLRGVLGQQGGEQIGLMIQALEDFRYDTLEIAIDKALEGDADMRITLGGLNPAVLDGHPFRFNISVKGNADRLLATILTVYRASGGVIEQGIKSLQ